MTLRDRLLADALCNVTPEAAGLTHCQACRKKLPPQGDVYWLGTSGESGEGQYVCEACARKKLR